VSAKVSQSLTLALNVVAILSAVFAAWAWFYSPAAEAAKSNAADVKALTEEIGKLHGTDGEMRTCLALTDQQFRAIADGIKELKASQIECREELRRLSERVSAHTGVAAAGTVRAP
jgi:hypothetical protein